jgi:hypothetical protein
MFHNRNVPSQKAKHEKAYRYLPVVREWFGQLVDSKRLEISFD